MKDGKTLHRLMDNAAYGKKMENLRNRVDVRLVSNEKYCLKQMSKLSYISQKIFDNDLVAMHKTEVTLKLNNWYILGFVYQIWETYLCLSSIIITSKIGMVTSQYYYSFTLIV